ncbi:glycosyltransferase family 2 protein [Lutimonas saemankumensis]|uniref:glycosyltransferase family 2 protein n=1 Tax=Lutimonas saemankumensis TaxID=483016 RepID=UPI001CD24D9E|nr:glycosyltransferase family 2 protein [Lutimonas saemankumensis]MCA0932222.1 glycosyltransferase family 2 protein [Lutimonas saemankumensis]
MSIQQKITAIIPTLNEESNIQGAIRSLSFAHEILVVDSFSSDRTLSICKRENVKVIQRRFDDFSSQKNFAIEQASFDWIFILDADERITPELASEVVEIVRDPKGIDAFNIYRTFFFKEKKVSFGGWQSDKVIRLFRKDKCRYDGKLVHEEIKCEGKIGFLKNRMDHFSYTDQEQYEKKLEFYALLQAKELHQNKSRVTFMHRLVKPAFRFVVLYFVRFGFLDGKKGLVLARVHAKGVLQRYLKYKELKT